MIALASGDMWAIPAAVRVNTVNCVGVMGKGVARAFRDRYPAMFRAYKEVCVRGELRPGVLHVWRSPTGETVVNLPTKTDWHRPSEYSYVEAGLRALRDELGRTAVDSVVTLPALGCGNGGLDWDRVLPMIEAHLGDLPQHLLVFPPADDAARPPDRAAGTSAQPRTRGRAANLPKTPGAIARHLAAPAGNPSRSPRLAPAGPAAARSPHLALPAAGRSGAAGSAATGCLRRSGQAGAPP